MRSNGSTTELCQVTRCKTVKEASSNDGDDKAAFDTEFFRYDDRLSCSQLALLPT